MNCELLPPLPCGAGMRPWLNSQSRLLRSRLSQGPGARARATIPPRTAGAGTNCLDLGGYFSGPLVPGWIIPEDPRTGMGLPDLPRGVVDLGGVPFEIRGVVQLAGQESRGRGATFPAAARGIPLPPVCRRIHFLHGTDGDLPSGTLLGRITVYAGSGAPTQIPLRYGEELAAAFSSNREAPRTPGSSIVWTAQSTGHLQDQTLYRTTWDNPHPEARTVMVDHESAVKRHGPCLLAITVEP